MTDQHLQGRILLPGSSSTFALRSMPQSMGARPMEVFQIRISPSLSPEMGARRMPPNTLGFPSRCWSVGISLGLKVRVDERPQS